MKPLAGHIVHYVLGMHPDGRPVIRPGIVVRICPGGDDECLHLQVFTDAFEDVNFARRASEGMLAVTLVRRSDEPVVGTWHWPMTEASDMQRPLHFR